MELERNLHKRNYRRKDACRANKVRTQLWNFLCARAGGIPLVTVSVSQFDVMMTSSRLMTRWNGNQRNGVKLDERAADEARRPRRFLIIHALQQVGESFGKVCKIRPQNEHQLQRRALKRWTSTRSFARSLGVYMATTWRDDNRRTYFDKRQQTCQTAQRAFCVVVVVVHALWPLPAIVRGNDRKGLIGLGRVGWPWHYQNSWNRRLLAKGGRCDAFECIQCGVQWAGRTVMLGFRYVSKVLSCNTKVV